MTSLRWSSTFLSPTSALPHIPSITPQPPFCSHFFTPSLPPLLPLPGPPPLLPFFPLSHFTDPSSLTPSLYYVTPLPSLSLSSFISLTPLSSISPLLYLFLSSFISLSLLFHFFITDLVAQLVEMRTSMRRSRGSRQAVDPRIFCELSAANQYTSYLANMSWGFPRCCLQDFSAIT